MPSKSTEWQALQAHVQEVQQQSLKNLVTNDPDRFSQFSVTAAGLLLDFSRNWLDSTTMALLVKLAEAQHLKSHIKALFDGVIVNISEQRKACHPMLRDLTSTDSEINTIREQLLAMADQLRPQFSDIVHIGIGGPHLGPKLVHEVLQQQNSHPINLHFVANLDQQAITQTLSQLNPKTTLIIVASKTFQTYETLTNANMAKQWLLASNPNAMEKQCVAITNQPHHAIEFGISEKNILPLPESIGGRFSTWSAVALPIVIKYGKEAFLQLLQGAHVMDQHFKTAPFEKNMPVILGLIHLWYRNFLHCPTRAIIPYAEALSSFLPYCQQLIMESTGKQVDQQGKLLDIETSPVIWGGVGTNSQHAFHQLLHQGSDLIPIDFILPITEQKTMIANCLAQSDALLNGKNQTTAEKTLPGNHPSTIVLLSKLDAYHLGALLALYEHQTYVQACIWGINCFDQWGVEHGKQLAQVLTEHMNNGEATRYPLIDYINELFKG